MNYNETHSHENNGAKPVQPDQRDFPECNRYDKDLTCVHFKDDCVLYTKVSLELISITVTLYMTKLIIYHFIKN